MYTLADVAIHDDLRLSDRSRSFVISQSAECTENDVAKKVINVTVIDRDNTI